MNEPPSYIDHSQHTTSDNTSYLNIDRSIKLGQFILISKKLEIRCYNVLFIYLSYLDLKRDYDIIEIRNFLCMILNNLEIITLYLIASTIILIINH